MPYVLHNSIGVVTSPDPANDLERLECGLRLDDIEQLFVGSFALIILALQRLQSCFVPSLFVSASNQVVHTLYVEGPFFCALSRSF